MKRFTFMLTLAFAAVVAGLSPVAAQNGVFSDPLVDYSFQLPEAKWKMTVKPSATSQNVEYVFGDRMDGHLEVRRLAVAADVIMHDVIQAEEQRLQFRMGFVAGREENFTGRFRGSAYNFEYVGSGRAMAGRFYFLRTDPVTVYVLRFTGLKDSLRSLRPQTDSIARTFAVK